MRAGDWRRADWTGRERIKAEQAVTRLQRGHSKAGQGFGRGAASRTGLWQAATVAEPTKASCAPDGSCQ
jgi:hypothetical protein